MKGKPAGHAKVILAPQLGFKEVGRPGSALSVDVGELQGIARRKSLAGAHRQLLPLVFDPGRVCIGGLAVKPGALHGTVGKE